MTFSIHVNKRNYTVSDHAAQRMLERFIPEELVIATLANGTITKQPHGTDQYEHQIYDEILEGIVIVRVIVNEKTRTIISVIDSTEAE